MVVIDGRDPGDARHDRPAVPGLRFRPFDPATDYPALVGLIHAHNRFDRIDQLPTVENLRNEHEHIEGFDPAAMCSWPRSTGRSAQPPGRLRGRVTAGAATTSMAGSRQPGGGRASAGHSCAGRSDAPRPWLPSTAGAGPRELETWIDQTQLEAVELLERTGTNRPLRIHDDSRPGRADPAAGLPDGLEIRPVEEADHRRIWDADIEAFRDHWNSAERTEADYQGWFAEPELDTSLWRVAWAGNEVAGSVMTSVWAAENEALGIRRGWLDHVSVRRPWRRRGLASALIVEALVGLRAAGMTEGRARRRRREPVGRACTSTSARLPPPQTTVKYRQAVEAAPTTRPPPSGEQATA